MPRILVPFSPLFYGIRDVTEVAFQRSRLKVDLSVPYFTGFVMLPKLVFAMLTQTFSFSPLFYGIRDVTN